MAEERKKASWSIDGSIYTVTFPSGHKTSFDTDKIEEEVVRTFLFLYGFKQNVSDTIAGYDGSDEDKADLMQAKYEELVAGVVRSKREAQPKMDLSKLRAELKEQGLSEETINLIIENSKKAKK